MNPTSQVAKPRRANCNSKRVMKLPFSNQTEALNSKSRTEVLLDLTLKEDGMAAMRSLSSSPPFFNGSPPSRPMNPLIHDVRFLNYGKQLTISAASTSPTPSPSTTCNARGQKNQAPTRVEGFDCPKEL